MFDDPAMGPQIERVERFKKMRMIEVLKLSEEESIRFFAKQTAHEEKVREFMKERNGVLDEIQAILDSSSKKDLTKLTDKIKDIEKRIFQERQRFFDDVEKLLTPEQYAKIFLFDREFGKQIRGAMEGMMKDRRGGPGGPPDPRDD